MGSNTLGTLYINLDLKNNLSKGLKAAQGQLAGAGKSFSAVGAGATSAGKSLTKNVTAPLAAVGAASVYTAVQFDDSMRKVKALTGATGNEFETLTDQARELGRTTRYKASEAADGMSYLAMAGFEVNEIMETMPDMLSLASASATDLATTADIASNILTGFGMEATEMGRAADVMALACASSNTDLTQLGEAMSYAAPVAKGFGMSIEETAAAVGFLSNAGIQSSMAGTTLRGMLTKLADPTNEATKKLEKYGIALEDVNPEVNSFTEILKTLKDAGVSTSDMMGIMGQRAGPGTAALLSQGYENLDIYTEKLENAEGAASRMAETMEEGPGGSMRKLSSALESVAITLGDTIADALLPFADTLANVAGKLSAFGEAHPTLLKIIVVLGGLAAAAGPVLMVIGMMATGIGAISTLLGSAGLAAALATVGGAIIPLAGIILPVVVAAGLLYAAFKNWDKIKEIAGNLYNWIKDSVVNTVKTLTGVDLTDSGTSMIKKLGVGLVMGTIGLPVVMAKLGLDLIANFVRTDFAKSAYEWIRDGIVSIIDTLTGVDLSGEGDAMMKKLGKGILLGIISPPLLIASMINKIIEKITGVNLFGVGYQFIDKLSGGMLTKLSDLGDKAKAKWDEITGAFGTPTEAVVEESPVAINLGGAYNVDALGGTQSLTHAAGSTNTLDPLTESMDSQALDEYMADLGVTSDYTAELGMSSGYTAADIAALGDVTTESMEKVTLNTSDATDAMSLFAQKVDESNTKYQSVGAATISISRQIAAEVIGAFSGINLFDAGAHMMETFQNGMKSQAPMTYSIVSNSLTLIDRLMPHSPAKEGPFSTLPNWSAIFDGIENIDAAGMAEKAVSGMSSAISGTAPSTMAANAAAGGGIGGNTYGGDTYEIKIGAVNNQADIDYLMSEIEKRNRSNRLKRGIGL